MSDFELKPIADVIRNAGKSAVLMELENAGCAPKGNRCRCPWEGCRDKGPARAYDASIFAGANGNYRVKCYSCSEMGDLVDLLSATRGMRKEEAIAHLRGLTYEPMPPPKVALKVVGSQRPGDADKMLPAEVARIWKSLSGSDVDGEAYLESRKLSLESTRGLVKFCVEKNQNEAVSYASKQGHRIAMLMSDVTGEARGIQIRMARALRDGETLPKAKSIKGSALEFFGRPEFIESSDTVHVTEGMFDTLSVAAWAPAGSCVVGAPGKDMLPNLAKKLRDAGVSVDGKTFCLYSQNDRVTDRGGNKSRQKFLLLAQWLAEDGARVVQVKTPAHHEDVGDWFKSGSMTAWPPSELAAAMDEPATVSTSDARQGECVVPMPSCVKADVLAQDFVTLVALLDDPAHRANTLGQEIAVSDEWWVDEMTGRRMLGDKPIKYPDDILRIKFRAEQNVSGRTSKPLRFSRTDIEDAIDLLCSRRTRHPVRDWLNGLDVWDRVERFSELSDRMMAVSPLAPTYLRRWCISAVARVMDPGCPMDAVLILTGGQGVGKSTFFRVMAGSKWHTDSMGDIRNKDSFAILSKFWVIEWAELDSMLRAPNSEAVKSFLSAKTDSYRPPYAHSVVDVPRPSVIVGTSNESKFLSDPTGARRYWTMAVGRIDLDWVREHREQLWAEALTAYKSGEEGRLQPDEQDAQAVDAEQFSAALEHPWTDIALAWSEKNSAVCQLRAYDALADIFLVPVERQDRKALRQAIAAFRAIGWFGPVKVRVGDSTTNALVRK